MTLRLPGAALVISIYDWVLIFGDGASHLPTRNPQPGIQANYRRLRCRICHHLEDEMVTTKGDLLLCKWPLVFEDMVLNVYRIE
jgi:hypothetical protein